MSSRIEPVEVPEVAAPPEGAASSPRGTASFLGDLIALTKPRITWLILMSTAIGCIFGQRPDFGWIAFLHTLAGTGLLASGTAALNQWYEWDADALMNRTRNRPKNPSPSADSTGSSSSGAS